MSAGVAKDDLDKRSKRGCLKFALLLILVVVAVVIVTIFIIVDNFDSNDSYDIRLTELLGREFTPFYTTVDENDVSDFNAKITQNVAAINGTPLVVNGVLDVETFISSNVMFRDSLSLDCDDIAVFANDFFAVQDAAVDGLSNNIFKIINLSLELVNDNPDGMQRVQYSAIFQIDLSLFSVVLPIQSSSVPSNMYVTLSATYNLNAQTQNAVESCSLQINRLSGDDNTYAVEQILNVFELSTNDIPALARAPFEYISRQCATWGVNFSVTRGTTNETLFVFSNR